MFIDASALVAILLRESGFKEIVEQIDAAPKPVAVSPLVRLEATLALARTMSSSAVANRPLAKSMVIANAAKRVEELFDRIEANEIAVSPEIGRLAVVACASFGKAAGHPAGLNFGECFAYACAKSLGVPLIYKGDDFAKTDLA